MIAWPQRSIVLALALAVLAGACSDSVSEEASEAVLARCEPVSAETLSLIETGLTIDNGALSNGAAVKSDFGPTLWVVGAQVNGDGFEGDGYIGIWAMVDGIAVDEIREIAAADDFTRGISTWGEDLWVEVSSLMDGVSAAGACVMAQQQS
jgi:hypothetical protein